MWGAVPVWLMVEGEEVIRYKNMELPDALKKIEVRDFHFNVHMDGKITFEIHYEQGAQLEFFPEPRARMARGAKSATKAEAPEVKNQRTAVSNMFARHAGPSFEQKKRLMWYVGTAMYPSSGNK